MLTLLFIILFFGIFGRMIGFAFKATWGIFKVMTFLVFLPLILVGLVFGGLISIAFPILVVVGLANLFMRLT
ncbi:MAG: hypothetical protein K6A61_12005 [Butyrivibrio sp.]|uniref:Uncharacterized protein n=1 Tax=Butyrivibrio hungatei TaxID=185008 RepID=A0A1G5CKV8_9FIRM|nr:hypothetical protein [Butyrivibrio hungatei]MBQ4220163.1 hypothetical protein [Butyrivibrio sp.]MBR4358143.1 hypothetical protein [Butyrivibrio sp.]MCR4998005.1 hypothetical protein [Butyrivibrio sp.]MEE3470962.1 hypothetical protein [Butyrivibrio hungatei]SCY02974.1 hypothetical protein SAMN02910451_01175 [Butyrivibrio hungatei]